MQNATDLSTVLVLPAEIADGELRTTGTVPGALVPLPFESLGDFSLLLRFVGGDVIYIAGRGLQVEALAARGASRPSPRPVSPAHTWGLLDGIHAYLAASTGWEMCP